MPCGSVEKAGAAVDPAGATTRLEAVGEVPAHGLGERDHAVEVGVASDQARIGRFAQHRALRYQQRALLAETGRQVPVAWQVEEAVEDEHGVGRQLGDQRRDPLEAVAVADVRIGQHAPADIGRRASMIYRELDDVPARGLAGQAWPQVRAHSSTGRAQAPPPGGVAGQAADAACPRSGRIRHWREALRSAGAEH